MPETLEQNDEPVPQPERRDGLLRRRGRVFQHADTPATTANTQSRVALLLVDATSAAQAELPWLRINWEIKALVPIACVLLGGMLLFLLATLSWRDPERHIVLLVAGAGAVAICGALLVVLTYTVQRPMVELQQKIAHWAAVT